MNNKQYTVKKTTKNYRPNRRAAIIATIKNINILLEEQHNTNICEQNLQENVKENLQEIVKENLQESIKENFVASIIYILSLAQNMIPSMYDIVRLKNEHINSNTWNNMEWYLFMTHHNIFDIAKYKKSLITRAKELAQRTLDRNFTTFIFMDGHGRFLYYLMHVLYQSNKNLNDFKFIVVDIDEISHDWHQNFFPMGVTNVHSDIFDYIMSNNAMSFSIPYLNFCGTNGQVQKIIQFINYIITINLTNNIPYHIAISYSIVRTAKSTTKNLLSLCNKVATNIEPERSDFKSFIL